MSCIIYQKTILSVFHFGTLNVKSLSLGLYNFFREVSCISYFHFFFGYLQYILFIFFLKQLENLNIMFIRVYMCAFLFTLFAFPSVSGFVV